MLVLFVLYAAEAIKLTDYRQFSLNLDANASAYFKFQGECDDAYLHQNNGKFEFWLIRNQSHRLYQSPYSTNLTFDWPDFKINGVAMNLVLYQGELDEPYYFDEEVFMSSIYSIYATNLSESIIEPLYKCMDYTEWFICAGILVIVSILIAIKHESITTILRPYIPRVIKWSRTFLSRS